MNMGLWEIDSEIKPDMRLRKYALSHGCTLASYLWVGLSLGMYSVTPVFSAPHPCLTKNALFHPWVVNPGTPLLLKWES